MADSNAVKSFYENNTRRFLKWGAGRETGVIHREVWGEGVKTKTQALHYCHDLLIAELPQGHVNPIRVLDLGCGIGSSLIYLCLQAEADLEGVGVTISPLQVERARQNARSNGMSQQCSFIEADFSKLPNIGTFDFVYSIEAFVHAPNAVQYFEQVSRVLNPGGRLCIIDDILEATSPEPEIDRFREGWQIGSLCSIAEIDQLAASVGLTTKGDIDLTAYLNLGRPRDWFIKGMLAMPGVNPATSPYIKSLDGGDALQQCLKNGWVSYRLLTFEKPGQ